VVAYGHAEIIEQNYTANKRGRISMLEIRQYHMADHDEVWNLHVLVLQLVGAYLGNGPWDNDLHAIEDFYLHNRGEFLVGIKETGREIRLWLACIFFEKWIG